MRIVKAFLLMEVIALASLVIVGLSAVAFVFGLSKVIGRHYAKT